MFRSLPSLLAGTFVALVAMPSGAQMREITSSS